MPKIIAFSDVHGNLSSLQLVWRAIQTGGYGKSSLLNAGDTVAYGPESEECARFIMEHSEITSVGGNYDYNVAKYPKKMDNYLKKWGTERPEKLSALREASDSISPDVREWLRNLPRQIVFELLGFKVALCHYAPDGGKEGLGSWTSDQRLLELSEVLPYDLVIVGHTHTPFVRRVGRTLFVNPGTVGASASSPTFAVIDLEQGGELIAEIVICRT